MRVIKILMFSLIIILLIAFSFDQVQRQKPLVGDKEILPYPLTFTLEASIYYANDEAMLEPEHKTLIIKNNQLVEAIIEALKKQPNLKNCHSTIDSDVKVLSSKIVNGKLYLNLNKAFVNSSYWKGNERQLVLYSLINSITQFDTIDRVQLRIEGEDINKYINDQGLHSEFTYNDAFSYRKPDSPEQVVLNFLNLISLERYDLAYNMLENSEDVDKDQFIATMTDYYRVKRSYEISQPFSKRNGSIISVHVQYQFYDSIHNITYDGGTEIWQLREAGKEGYRIIWPRDDD